MGTVFAGHGEELICEANGESFCLVENQKLEMTTEEKWSG